MDKMIDTMLQFGQLNAQQIALIKSHLTTITLQKGDYFSEAAKIAHRVGFLTDGVLRVCYYNNKGNEITRCFMEEGRFAVDMNSFYNALPSSEYVEAVTPCEMLVLSRESYTTLANTIVGWTEIFAKISASSLMGKMQVANIMLMQDATERYHGFLERCPGLANRVPLGMLASYLGITQSSLSRIRKNIV